MAKGGQFPEELLRFNAFLAEQEERAREQRRVSKAERAKQLAAARVREVQADPRATREEKLAAEAAYRQAVDAWRAARRGEEGGAGESLSDGDDEAAG